MHQVRKVEALLNERAESLAIKYSETQCGHALDELLQVCQAYTTLHAAVSAWETSHHGHTPPSTKPAPTLSGGSR